MNPLTPVIIAVYGSSGRSSQAVRGLAHQLQRKGLHVQTLRRLEDSCLGDSDVLLIPCSGEASDGLADQIEAWWSKRWFQWYSSKTRKGVSHGKR